MRIKKNKSKKFSDELVDEMTDEDTDSEEIIDEESDDLLSDDEELDFDEVDNSSGKKRGSAIVAKGDRAEKLAQRVEAGKRSMRRPICMLPKGQPVKIRFRNPKEFWTVWQHGFQSSLSKKKDNWVFALCPDTDSCPLCRVGVDRYLMFCYEVINRDGYYSQRNRKQLTNIPQFLEVSSKIHKQIQQLVKDLESRGRDLRKRDVKITRVDRGVVTMIPESPSKIKNSGVIPRLDPEEFYRAPDPMILKQYANTLIAG